jgi:choline kinase
MLLSFVVLAAGRASRFGRLKQLEPIGPSDEALFEYAVHDAVRAGCHRVVFVTRPDLEPRLRAHVAGRLGDALRVEFVIQDTGDLPAGFRVPAGRTKPWGTGHAVLTLRRLVREPFIVCNADDFYGPRSIGRLARRVRDALTTGDPSHFVIGYRLKDTLLPTSGGANRGICRCDKSGFAESIEEVREIRHEGSAIAGLQEDGSPCLLTGDELASMNLWAFQPSIFEPLWHRFERFHAETDDPIADEFLLSSAVGGLVESRRVRVRVIPTEDSGLALTFPEDREEVASGVNEAVAAGDYPIDLAAWFRARRGTVPG